VKAIETMQLLYYYFGSFVFHLHTTLEKKKHIALDCNPAVHLISLSLPEIGWKQKAAFTSLFSFFSRLISSAG
jgi:hypothetical protein